MKSSMGRQRQESIWLKGVLGRTSAATKAWAAAWVAGLSLLLIAGPLLPASHFFDNQANYTPLHTLLELAAIAVSSLVFALGWSLRRQPYNAAAVLLGCAALCVLLIDLAHTLSYPGMPDFLTPSDPEKAINFWLAGRLVAALSLLAVAFMPFRQWSLSGCRLLLGASIAAAALVWWIGLFHQDWLPRSFTPGQGLTAAKIYSEYALAAMYMSAAAGFLWRVLQRGREDAVWLAAASWVLALTELFLTLYRDVTDLFNLLGHVQKVIAYGMIYRAVFSAGVVAPQKALRAREYLYHSLFLHMLNGFAYCRMLYEDDKPVDFTYLSVNPAFEQQTGLRNVTGRKVSEVIPGIQQALPELFTIYGRVARTGKPESFEIYVPPLADWFSIAVYCPRPDHFVAVFDVVTERKKQQARIDRLMRVYAFLSSINSTIVRVHDRQALLESACAVAVEVGQFGMAWIGLLQPGGQALRPAASRGVDLSAVQEVPLSTGASLPDGQGSAYEALHSKRAVYCNDLASQAQVGPVRALAIKQGYRSACILPLVVDGQGVGIMGLYARETDFFDADEMKLLDELAADISFALQYIAREERLNYLAFYDGLTGLANRTLFLDRLNQLLRNADDSQHQVAAILLDLDRLARINESYGRHVGDALLKQVAERLQGAVREPCSLARIGADRFAVAISHLRNSADAAAVVQDQILPALAACFVVEGTELQITARAGIALYPEDGRDADSLLQCAKAALREAQSSGARSLYYAPEINARVAASLVMEKELRHALEAGEFVVYYQPRVDLRSGRIGCAEALIRWQHPHRGLLAPGAFIELAEECGLIVPIGAWVFDAVCAQQAAWLAEGLDIVPVSVNLSPAQFQQDQLLAGMEASLARHGLDARYLELELTESLVMRNPEAAAETMQGFRNCGLRLSLDDFGTGYSSLAYLRHFPVDFVKIDRTFIRDITQSPDDAAIATAVIAMAHRLNLKVVAEGVETEGQMRYLRRHDCDQIQGYFFSPPAPAEAFSDMLRAAKCLQFTEAAPAASRTVLVVDDEAGVQAALHRVLRREGYRVLKADSGEEALDLLALNSVQVIVSDQRMPGMSGSEFLSIVKELYPDTVRIILSGYTDLQVITDAVNRGAVYKFLTKPWDDELLKEQIRDAFLRYRPLPSMQAVEK